MALAAIAVGAYFLLAGETVTVPNLVGRDAGEAADILHDAGLEVAFVNVESDDVPRDEVISQDPDAGEEVREGTTVTVTVSGGKGTVAGPGRRRRAARGRRAGAAGAGFKTEVEQAFSDTVPEGDVISHSPEAGKQATKGRTITLTVSQGQEGVAVPGLVGNSATRPSSSSPAAGLTAEVTEKETSQPPGTVIEQNPAEGRASSRAPP